MKYYVNGNCYETAEDAAQYISENIDTELYDNMLDECFEMVNICGCEYYPSITWKEIDPIAYNCGFNDYCDSCYSDILYELERMDDMETIDQFGFEVTAEEEEEEAEEI